MVPVKKPATGAGPTPASAGPASCDGASFEKDLAARLFVKTYEPGGGRTPEYHAQLAVEAAAAFVATYQQIHR